MVVKTPFLRNADEVGLSEVVSLGFCLVMGLLLHESLPVLDTHGTTLDSARRSNCTECSKLLPFSSSLQSTHCMGHIPSQQQPGYLLSFQVPPTLLLFSRITKFRDLLCLIKSMAMHIPHPELAVSSSLTVVYVPTRYSGPNNDYRRIGEVLISHRKTCTGCIRHVAYNS